MTWHADRCAACGRLSPGDLLADHCHRSGLLRGLLCGICNTAEGNAPPRHPRWLRYRTLTPALILGVELSYSQSVRRRLAQAFTMARPPIEVSTAGDGELNRCRGGGGCTCVLGWSRCRPFGTVHRQPRTTSATRRPGTQPAATAPAAGHWAPPAKPIPAAALCAAPPATAPPYPAHRGRLRAERGRSGRRGSGVPAPGWSSGAGAPRCTRNHETTPTVEV
ncbi:endonuclease VII domain-containing protein (plasmid) [Streptomyces microflavus]|uniref:endonuclease domain-containing protein n=1 Tax=Streptomyces microflavus TaxID=1919 RepID=UPI002E0FE799|nr:endonuclease VII domain-containing protein [Streptomyces microflavus]